MGNNLPDYTVSHPRSHYRENFKPLITLQYIISTCTVASDGLMYIIFQAFLIVNLLLAVNSE
jgi:hypothetical protein